MVAFGLWNGIGIVIGMVMEWNRNGNWNALRCLVENWNQYYNKDYCVWLDIGMEWKKILLLPKYP